MKYRLEQTFDNTKENELRLQEQFSYKSKTLGLKSTHRMRTEQRFYTSVIKHRFRYQFGFTIPLGKESESGLHLKTATEALLELAKTQKPEYEQRLKLSLGWLLNPQTIIEFGTEYQLSDYTQNMRHELFLVAELGLTLQ